MSLYKSFYSLWGNFCYPLSVFFKLRIKLRFYCQKSSVYRFFGHRKNDLKDCSSRSLKDIKIYTLQDNGCCTITSPLFPLAPCKSILNTFVYGIYQRVSVLFELSVKHTLSDFLLPFRCHEWRKFNSKKYR